MKKILLATALLFFYCTTLLSQLVAPETWNWAFGQKAGLTWNTTQSLTVVGLEGTPDATLDNLPTIFTSSINTAEGCFSLSDSDGNFLFYSDGMTIWNKNHAVMSNGTGMKGNNSSAQSGIIFPYPGETDKYVAVSISAAGEYQLAYSVIDMTQDGGLGSVITKNIDLLGGQGYMSETVTSIRHANGEDYWIIVPGRGNPTRFNVWKFTKDGAAATPVISTATGISTNETVGAYGYIKVSPDGKHFAFGTNPNSSVIFGDFDNSTGVLSNIKQRTGFSTVTYGIEFSPSGKILFVGRNGAIEAFIFEDLLAATNPNTVAKKNFEKGTTGVTALQNGPDGRLYGSGFNQKVIYFIDNPDDYENLRFYQFPAGFLGAGTSMLGIPSFAANWFSAKASAKSFVCLGNEFKYTVEISMLEGTSGSDLPVKLVWDFGDGSTPVEQAIVSGVTVYKQTYNYPTNGSYTITITPYKSDGTKLTASKLPANVIDCAFKTNRMIRLDIQNTATKATNR